MSQDPSDPVSPIKRASDHAAAHPELRSAGRINSGQLKCNLGRVLDLSAGGVRLISRRKLSGRHEIRLFDQDVGVRIEAEVRSFRRHGLWKHEIRFQFLNVPSDIADQLTTLATKNQI